MPEITTKWPGYQKVGTPDFNVLFRACEACDSQGRIPTLPWMSLDTTKEQNVQALIIGTDDFYVVDAVRENGTFEWTSGVPFAPACSVCINFTSNGNCLGIKSSKSHPTMFHWDNVDCSAKNSFLCEMTALEKPSPSTEPPPRKLCPIGYNWKAYRNTDYCFWKVFCTGDALFAVPEKTFIALEGCVDPVTYYCAFEQMALTCFEKFHSKYSSSSL
ncbi:macrophage mannose receptor 1 [Trichonephila clavipes]|nr:macrophage mannose receptor 1 [Trichonephila clavipes]